MTPSLGYARNGNPSPSPRRANPFEPSIQRSNSPATNSISWICTICSQANQLPPHFDASTANAHTPLTPCSTCGVKPSLAHVLKAAISNASGRQGSSPLGTPGQSLVGTPQPDVGVARSLPYEFGEVQAPLESRLQCPRCTFLNHPSLRNCELCGAPLGAPQINGSGGLTNGIQREDSPGPVLENGIQEPDSLECIKLSFRSGGEKVFYDRLKGAMQQRKWVLQNAPPVPQPEHHDGGLLGIDGFPQKADRPKVVGIAGLERRGQ